MSRRHQVLYVLALFLTGLVAHFVGVACCSVAEKNIGLGWGGCVWQWLEIEGYVLGLISALLLIILEVNEPPSQPEETTPLVTVTTTTNAVY